MCNLKLINEICWKALKVSEKLYMKHIRSSQTMKSFLKEGFKSMWDFINYEDYSECKELFELLYNVVPPSPQGHRPYSHSIFGANKLWSNIFARLWFFDMCGNNKDSAKCEVHSFQSSFKMWKKLIHWNFKIEIICKQ